MHLKHSLEDMETIRDQHIRVANEGLRLVMNCKVPPLCSTGGSDNMEQQQREKENRSKYMLPPLLDWIEQHRHTLLDPSLEVVQKFQKYFVLVFLEQLSTYTKYGFLELSFRNDLFASERQLMKIGDDVERILTSNAATRNWLFHYYGSELGMQGWQRRPGDVYSLGRLIDFLKDHRLDVLFGQRMLSFLEKIGTELLRYNQNSEYQAIGIQIMATVMEICNQKQLPWDDAEEILRMALQLNLTVGDEYGDELWSIIYYSVSSIHSANNPLDEEVMVNLLSHLNEQILRKEDDSNVPFSDGTLGYLKAVTLMLLLDVPEVDLHDYRLDDLTISGRLCDRGKFRRHVKSHLRTNNTRFSIHIRLRIAKMIPKLFAGFTSTYFVDSPAYNCLELLTWMTMFPVSVTKQHKNVRGFMLKRLMEEIKRLCENFIRNPSGFSYDEDDLHELCTNLHCLLSVVRDGIKQLPNAGMYRRYRCDMEMRLKAVFLLLELLKCFREDYE